MFRYGQKHKDRPAILDKVYNEGRLAAGRQPNGYIKQVHWYDNDECTVFVQYYENTEHPREIVAHPGDDLEDCWDGEAFGGTWFIDATGG